MVGFNINRIKGKYEESMEKLRISPVTKWKNIKVITIRKCGDCVMLVIKIFVLYLTTIAMFMAS